MRARPILEYQTAGKTMSGKSNVGFSCTIKYITN
nr:MAG TPA: hypothetical protein [Caudoviricetes sp.]